MRSRLAILAGVAALLAVPGGAHAQRSEQDAAYESRQQGRAMPLRVVERRVVTQMRGYDYLGNPIYFETTNVYRFTFIRRNEVVRVDADAGSGRIVDRSDR
ncbi:MAG: hypothetical protein ABR601_10455 [Parasphingopyxis sp.]|nr:hypothetical protein [Sphingomonadales bacterium]